MTNVKELLENYGVDKFLEYVGATHIRKIGDSYRSCCPIHKGDNSSAFSYHNGYFTCFSECNRNFSAIDVIMNVFNIPFPLAKEKLEKLLGQKIDEENKLEINLEHLENRQFIADFNNIKEKKAQKEDIEFIDLSNKEIYKPITHEYLFKEGFDDKTRDFFDLRFCNTGVMKDRVVIPIDRPDGKIMGIAGRSICDFRWLELTGESKYFFSKGLKKSNTLYNISRVDVYENCIIVVEGYKSVWRLHQWGYDNSVALMGASLSDEQARLILGFDLPILVSGDNDKAGKKLEKEVLNKLSKFTPIEIFPIEKVAKNEKDSIAEIKKEDFNYWKTKIMGKYPSKILF